jgi:hypothetical protein
VPKDLIGAAAFLASAHTGYIVAQTLTSTAATRRAEARPSRDMGVNVW